MRSVVYVDVLLLVNFLIAVVLLLGAGRLCGAFPEQRRILLGGAAAALCSLALLAPEWNEPLQLVYKGGSAALCVALAYPGRSLRQLLQAIAWYFLLNLALTGIVIAAILNGSANRWEVNNLSTYYAVSPVLLLVCVAGIYVTLRVVLSCFERSVAAHALLSVTLLGSEIRLDAFEDTGLRLAAPFSDWPVLLVYCGALHKALPEPELLDYLENGMQSGQPPQPQWGMQMVPYQTAGNQGLFPMLPAENLTLKTGDSTMKCKKVWLAICLQPFANQCDAAFGPELLAASTRKGARYKCNV